MSTEGSRNGVVTNMIRKPLGDNVVNIMKTSLCNILHVFTAVNDKF